jgi:hypothetical protein
MPPTKKSKRMFLMLEVDVLPDSGHTSASLAESARAAIATLGGVNVLQMHVNVAKPTKSPAAAGDAGA